MEMTMQRTTRQEIQQLRQDYRKIRKLLRKLVRCYFQLVVLAVRLQEVKAELQQADQGVEQTRYEGEHSATSCSVVAEAWLITPVAHLSLLQTGCEDSGDSDD